MNAPEDYDDKIECLNTHPDLLPPADNKKKKLLERDSAVLVKALKPRVVPCASKAAMKAISPRVSPRGTVVPAHAIRSQMALKKAFQSYEKTIRSGLVMWRPLQASRKAASL